VISANKRQNTTKYFTAFPLFEMFLFSAIRREREIEMVREMEMGREMEMVREMEMGRKMVMERGGDGDS
jgi:hypothetical protein